MLKAEETLEIKEIERVRKSCGAALDDKDNFSWHVALRDGETVYGAARLYPYGGGVYLDRPYLSEEFEPYREMLFRTLLLKASALPGYAYAARDVFNEKFGFMPFGDVMRVKTEEIVFPKLCGG
jgi:hypothetical protein